MTRNGPQYQRGNRKIDHFAEAIAETGEITSAAAMIGVSRQAGKDLLRRIRRELGWQAQ